MGGDQVYPTAERPGVRGPLRGARTARRFPAVADGRAPPTLFALPGNHDWYDGLTAFLRLFARREGAHIGGWQTAQTRSYFALKLPHRWWLFAIDEQVGAYIDDPQLEYFREVAAKVEPGRPDHPLHAAPDLGAGRRESQRRTTRTDYFLRKMIAPTGAEVAAACSPATCTTTRATRAAGGS